MGSPSLTNPTSHCLQNTAHTLPHHPSPTSRELENPLKCFFLWIYDNFILFFPDIKSSCPVHNMLRFPIVLLAISTFKRTKNSLAFFLFNSCTHLKILEFPNYQFVKSVVTIFYRCPDVKQLWNHFAFF